MKYPLKILAKLYTSYEIMFNHKDFSTMQFSKGFALVCDDWDMANDAPAYSDYSDKEYEGEWFIRLIFESFDSIEIYEE